MASVVWDLGVPAFSFVFGALLTRWWNRARPLIVLQRFQELMNNNETVECNSELEKLTEVSWSLETIYAGKCPLGKVIRVEILAKKNKSMLENARDILPSALEELRNATNVMAVRNAVEALICNDGIAHAMDIILKRDVLTVQTTPEAEISDRPPLTVIDCPDNDGCYQILWKAARSTFSGGLNKEHAGLKNRLEPFVDAVKYLYKPALLQAFEMLVVELDRQIRLLSRVVEITGPIIEAHGRWSGRVLIANFGNAPMMVWPEALISIKHEPSKGYFKLPAITAYEDEKKPNDIKDVDGMAVIGPGQKTWFRVITRDKQGEMTNGELLKTLYNQKDARVKVTLFITRRGMIFGKRSRSDWVFFQESTGS